MEEKSRIVLRFHSKRKGMQIASLKKNLEISESNIKEFDEKQNTAHSGHK